MNTDLTEIAFILDRSGSMSSMVEAAITGFNEFLKDQQSTPGDANLTVILFDNEYLIQTDARPINSVPPLDTTTFVPRGSTALLDTIGRTIDDLGNRVAAMPEADRPGKVIIAILTDGYENASERFTWADIAEKIRHQSEVYQWEFLFLGANQDAIATAGRINISRANAATYAADAVGQTASPMAFSRKIKAMRRKKELFTDAEHLQADADIKADLSEILSEEDNKRRGSKP